jgi:hypothetical protein
MTVRESTASAAVSTSCDRSGHGMVWLVGVVDRAVAVETSGVIRGLVASGIRDVVVDVAGVLRADGRLLSVLAAIRADLEAPEDGEAPGSLTVIGVVVPTFLDALGDADLDGVFLLYDAVRRHREAQHRVPAPRHAVSDRPGAAAGW